MYPAITSIALALIFIAEFFIGWHRKTTKSAVRLAVVAGMAGISLLVTIFLTNSILLLIMNMAGLAGESLSAVFSAAFSETGLSADTISALSSSASSLFSAVAAPIVFLCIFWLLKLVSWIAFAVVYKIRENSVKIPVPSEPAALSEPQIYTAPTVQSDRRKKLFGGLITGASIIFSAAAVIFFFSGDAGYIIEIAPTAVEIASAKSPETKEDFDGQISRFKTLTDAVFSLSSVSDKEKTEIADGIIKTLIINIDSKAEKVAEKIKFDSVVTLRSDLDSMFAVFSWANENSLLVGGEKLGDAVTKLGKEKTNELFDLLSSLSFGKELISEITAAVLSETLGEECSEKAEEIFASFENSDELKEAIVEIVDVAPIVKKIQSGELSGEDAEAEIDNALEQLEASPLIDSETLDQLRAKAEELKNGGIYE